MRRGLYEDLPALACLLLLALGSCDAGTREPISRFRLWHQALARGDRPALARLMTEKSRAYLDHLPERSSSRHDARILEARREGSRVYLRVRDESPRAEVAEGTFVVVREDGEWRVDLLATAGRNSRETDIPGKAPTRVVPVRLPEWRRRKAAAMFEARYRRGQRMKR